MGLMKRQQRERKWEHRGLFTAHPPAGLKVTLSPAGAIWTGTLPHTREGSRHTERERGTKDLPRPKTSDAGGGRGGGEGRVRQDVGAVPQTQRQRDPDYVKVTHRP